MAKNEQTGTKAPKGRVEGAQQRECRQGEQDGGRGCPPRSFKIWGGSAAHREWKSKHPT